jgi:hypothetical protein
MDKRTSTTEGCLTTFLGGCFTITFLSIVIVSILGWIFT